MVIPLITTPYIVADLRYRKRDFPLFARLRDALPAAFWKGVTAKHHYHKMVRDWAEGVSTVLLYHRLGLPYWQQRFTVKGPQPQEHPEWGKRPVVFAFLHTGAFGVIPCWLRSRGVPAVSLVGGLPAIIDNEYYARNVALGDQRYGLAGLTHAFERDGGLREVTRFLTPGNALVVALDGGLRRDEEATCDAGGLPIQIKKGACRIAAQANAIVIPVAVRRTGMCRFEITFHDALPEELLHQADLTPACQYLVSKLWPAVQEHPDDINWTTLEALAPALRAPRIGWP
jgi:lauroyl/myristoyl acyltransferase